MHDDKLSDYITGWFNIAWRRKVDSKRQVQKIQWLKFPGQIEKGCIDESFSLWSHPIIQTAEDLLQDLSGSCHKGQLLYKFLFTDPCWSETTLTWLFFLFFFFVDLKLGLLGDKTTIAKILFCLYSTQLAYFTTHEDELSLVVVVVDYGSKVEHKIFSSFPLVNVRW